MSQEPLKRWQIWCDNDGPIAERPDGEWVLWDDVAALLAERDALQQQVKALQAGFETLKTQVEQLDRLETAVMSEAGATITDRVALDLDRFKVITVARQIVRMLNVNADRPSQSIKP